MSALQDLIYGLVEVDDETIKAAQADYEAAQARYASLMRVIEAVREWAKDDRPEDSGFNKVRTKLDPATESRIEAIARLDQTKRTLLASKTLDTRALHNLLLEYEKAGLKCSAQSIRKILREAKR